jgi:hypothetical protein
MSYGITIDGYYKMVLQEAMEREHSQYQDEDHDEETTPEEYVAIIKERALKSEYYLKADSHREAITRKFAESKDELYLLPTHLHEPILVRAPTDAEMADLQLAIQTIEEAKTMSATLTAKEAATQRIALETNLANKLRVYPAAVTRFQIKVTSDICALYKLIIADAREAHLVKLVGQ